MKTLILKILKLFWTAVVAVACQYFLSSFFFHSFKFCDQASFQLGTKCKCHILCSGSCSYWTITLHKDYFKAVNIFFFLNMFIKSLNSTVYIPTRLTTEIGNRKISCFICKINEFIQKVQKKSQQSTMYKIPVDLTKTSGEIWNILNFLIIFFPFQLCLLGKTGSNIR